MEDMFRTFYQNLPSFYQNLPLFYQNLPSLNVGAGVPVIGVAETKDAIEVNAELPGVDEKDIKVSLDGNRLAISGEKKGETKKDEKDWHVEERSYGSFVSVARRSRFWLSRACRSRAIEVDIAIWAIDLAIIGCSG
jgi:HSP20 family protein